MENLAYKQRIWKQQVTKMNTLHYQDELDNQPKNLLNQVKVHSAHQKLFQPRK